MAGHQHHGHHHHHGVSADADQGKLVAALAITASVVVAEVVAGLLANSLALLSDAAHNVTDAASIGLALFAVRLAARPATARFTYGFKRAEIMSAQVNGAALVALGLVIGVDAVRRLFDPPAVTGEVVIALGLVGGAANLAAAWVLSRAQRHSLNVTGAMQHILTDLYASAAAVAAGVAVLLFAFPRADAIAALVVVAIMFRSGWGLLRDSGRILLEGSPEGTDVEAIGHAMASLRGVREVHDLHVWEVTSGFPSLSAHVLVAPGADCHGLRADLERLLRDRFGVSHSTLQVDHQSDEGLLQIG